MSNKTIVYRSFGTILKSQSKAVRALASNFNAKIVPARKPDKPVPKVWNFMTEWSDMISEIRDQGTCGSCWSQAVVCCLQDRFGILTDGTVQPILSAYQLTTCYGVVDSGDIKDDSRTVEQINLTAHTNAACTGNTIYNAVQYLYRYGVQSTDCFDQNMLASKGLTAEGKLDKPTDLPYCSRVIGDDYSKCLDLISPARFYRIITSYNVEPTVDAIKFEIAHWGPVVSGLIMYPSFSEWDGIGVYMGPTKDESIEGGHAIRIMGWGEELVNGVMTPFWWIANSWSTNWGYSGYCKVRIGIKECELEDNVVAFIPDIPTYKIEYNEHVSQQNPEDDKEREYFNVDPLTGYRRQSLDYFRERHVQAPELFQLSLLQDYNNFWAADARKTRHLLPLYYQNLGSAKYSPKRSLDIVIGILILLFIFLLYKSNRR